jgi:hypothetical protein
MAGLEDRPLAADQPETVCRLHLRREGFLSSFWLISERSAGPALGVWKKSLARESGKLLLGERRYELGREGLAGDFTMRRRGHAALRATKPSVFSERLVLRGAGRRLELRSRLFHSGHDVLEHARRIGRCGPTRWYGSNVALTVDRDLPLELAVFTLWLTKLMLERSHNAG